MTLIIAQTRRVGRVVAVVHETVPADVQQIQPAAGADPQAARVVLQHGAYAVVTQTAGQPQSSWR